MTLVTFIYDASTGDDGNGGTNEPSTAVTDTTSGETISTAASTTQTFSSAVDLTGMPTDGSGGIFIDTPAGERLLFRVTGITGPINAVTAITTAEAADGTDSTLAFGVGGIRQTFVSDGTHADFTDMGSGWDFSLQDTAAFALSLATPIAFASGAGNSLADGPIRILAAAGDSPTITWTEGVDCFNLVGTTKLHVEGVTISNTTSTSISARCFRGSAGSNNSIVLIGVTIDSPGPCVQTGTSTHLVILDSDLQATATNAQAIDMNSGRIFVSIHGSVIHDSDIGIDVDGTSGLAGSSITGNVVRDHADDGIRVAGNIADQNLLIKNNVCHDNGGSGISIDGTHSVNAGPIVILNNILTDNAQFGIERVSGTTDSFGITITEDFNFFRGNTSGETLGILQGANDVTLTADPYTDEASDDYSLNATAGGGAAVRDAGFGRTS